LYDFYYTLIDKSFYDIGLRRSSGDAKVRFEDFKEFEKKYDAEMIPILERISEIPHGIAVALYDASHE
jgi:hypothetical protein